MSDISLINILKEIGDLSNTPFNYNDSFQKQGPFNYGHKEEYINSFKDDENNNIEIKFQHFNVPTGGDGYNVGFDVNGQSLTISLSNKDAKYYLKLMNTLSRIIKEFINKYNPEALNIKGSDVNKERQDQKDNIYYEYVKKNIPSSYTWTSKGVDNSLYIYKPNQKQQTQIKMRKDLREWQIKNSKNESK